MTEDTYEDLVIEQIIPTKGDVVAVFGETDTGLIYRNKVVCWALMKHRLIWLATKECYETWRVIHPMDWCDGEREITRADESINFLGLEFDGAKKEWSKEMEELKKREAEWKKEFREKHRDSK